MLATLSTVLNMWNFLNIDFLCIGTRIITLIPYKVDHITEIITSATVELEPIPVTIPLGRLRLRNIVP